VLPLAIATCALTWQGSRRGSSDATPAGTEGDTAISHRIISPAALLLRLAAGLALLLPAAGCAPARLLNALVPGDGYRLERDLAYGANPRQRLDLYLPDGLGSPAPVVVFFYGGSWQYGSKADYRFVGQALAAQSTTGSTPRRAFPASSRMAPRRSPGYRPTSRPMAAIPAGSIFWAIPPAPISRPCWRSIGATSRPPGSRPTISPR
jgi:hypothetical protein